MLCPGQKCVLSLFTKLEGTQVGRLVQIYIFTQNNFYLEGICLEKPIQNSVTFLKIKPSKNWTYL